MTAAAAFFAFFLRFFTEVLLDDTPQAFLGVDQIVLDIRGEEKKHLTVEDLLHQFEKVSGQEFASDKALLG